MRELSVAFLAAVIDGDIDRLATMLTEDVVHIPDGGRDRHAARRPVLGAAKVARLFVNLARREWLPTDELRWVEVNGQPGAYVVRNGEPYLLTVLGWRDGRVAESLVIVNPDKLRHFHESQTGALSCLASARRPVCVGIPVTAVPPEMQPKQGVVGP